jgi:hypothetical protein
MPKLLPRRVVTDSAIMASLAAVLRALPILSKPIKTTACCQVLENARSNLRTAEVN